MKNPSLIALAAVLIGLSGCVAYPLGDHGERGGQRDRGGDQDRDHRDDHHGDDRDHHPDCDPRNADCPHH